MTMLTPFHLLVITFLASQVATINHERGYYWRDYKWKIPLDAYPCGLDSSGKQTYIGQAYFHGIGILVVQILPGSKEVFAGYQIPRKAASVIRILCSRDRNAFQWVSTNATTFNADLSWFQPVIGGFNHAMPNKEMLYVGRLAHDVMVGSVLEPSKDAKMVYVNGTSYQEASEFEVLVYDN